jgi:O-antigen ligase/tetratricopeptide (TPR) repeat protein
MVQFVPNFGAIDKSASQFFYLAIIAMLSSFFLFRNMSYGDGKIIYKHNILLAFFSLSILGLLSILWSFNPVEGLINFFELLLITFSLYNLTLHFKSLNPNFKEFSQIFIFILFFDVLNIFLSFLSIYNFETPPTRNDLLVGFSSNLNITAFSLLFRIPFVLFFILTSKSVLNKTVHYLLFGITLFCIIISGSRGAIISFVLLLICFLIYSFFFLRDKRKLLVILSFFSLFIFGIQTFLYQNGSTVVDRVSTLTPTVIKKDSSTNERLTWFNAAFEGIKEKPLFGHGIGNWKIVGNKYVSNSIEQYIVPKYVHNDFIEAFVELGFLGGLFFLLIFALIISTLYKLKKKLKVKYVELSVILFSIFAYILDSNLNFPFQRPIALINLCLVTSYIISLDKLKPVSIKRPKIILALIFIAQISILVSTVKVYIGYVDEVEFRNRISHRRGFKDATLESIDQLNHFYPNITYTTIPLITFKGLFNWKNGNIKKAKKMLIEGNKINPYLYVAESNLASIYLEEGKIDSAYYFAKKAFYGLPNNERHANIYQTAIAAKGELNELDNVFDITRKKKKELIYANHLTMISFMKVYDSFTKKDKEVADEAIKLFPDNKIIRKYNRIINETPESISKANQYDKAASEYFEKGQFNEAIGKWKEAKNILPVESSYYLNIAQSLSILNDYESSNSLLDSVTILGIDKNSGKLEYLRAMNKILANKYELACRDLIISYRKGYVDETLSLIKRFNCANRLK